MTGDLVEQIAGVLADRALTLGEAFGRVDVGAELASLADRHAAALAARLVDDELPDDELASLVRALVTLQWGDGEPPADWWPTPLGRVAARSVGADSAEAITPTVAAAMLGVTPTRVQQLRTAGKLDRHPDGGVTRGSVLARLAREQ